MKKIMKWQAIKEQRKEEMKKLLLKEQKKAMKAAPFAETENTVKEAINASTEDNFKMSGLLDMIEYLKKYRLLLSYKAKPILVDAIDKMCYIISVVRYQWRNLMENGIAPRSITGHTFVRNFITSTLIKTATTVAAQNQFVLQSISDDNPKTIDLNTATFVAASPKKINVMNFSLNNHINQHANINLRAYPEYLQMKSRYRRNHSANIESESAKK